MSGVPGSKVTVVAFDEQTYKNVAATPSGQRMYFAQFQLAPDQGREQSEVLSGFRGRNRSMLGARSVAGTINTEVGPESVGFWLKHLIGRPTTTGTGPYQHVFEVGEGDKALPPGITFEQDFTSRIATPGRFMRYRGCRINSATFTFSQSGAIGLAMNLTGADWDNSAIAPLDATPTDTGHRSFSAQNVAIVLSDGSALELCMKSLTLNFDNDLDPDQYCINHGGTRAAMDEGFFTVDGQFVALHQSAALLQKAMSDTDASLAITMQRGSGNGTAGNEKLLLEVPDLVIAPTGPQISGPRGLELNCQFTAHRGTGEIAVKATLDNALEDI